MSVRGVEDASLVVPEPGDPKLLWSEGALGPATGDVGSKGGGGGFGDIEGLLV
jgi:hypothetical protein